MVWDSNCTFDLGRNLAKQTSHLVVALLDLFGRSERTEAARHVGVIDRNRRDEQNQAWIDGADYAFARQMPIDPFKQRNSRVTRALIGSSLQGGEREPRRSIGQERYKQHSGGELRMPHPLDAASNRGRNKEECSRNREPFPEMPGLCFVTGQQLDIHPSQCSYNQ